MINEGREERIVYDNEKETDSLLGLSDSEVPKIEGEHDALGAKSLNSFYSIVFIINQIYGPGVLAIPGVFQQSGFLYTTIVLGFFLFVSCFASTLLCEALSLIPGNKNFEKHIEYTVGVKYYFGRKFYIFFQLLLNVCMQSYNIASIIVCAESLDQFMTYVFRKTWALQILPHPEFLTITDTNFLYDSPEAPLCLSLGYIIVALICMPTGFLNLADNVKVVQLGSFIVLVVLLVEFCGQFIYMGVHFSNVPALGQSYGQLVGIFIFSWAFTMFIPSWVNEKRNDVSVNKVVWGSGIASFFGYLCIGLLAAVAMPSNLSGSDNILGIMATPGYPVLTILACYIFSLGVIAPGIPVCCITTRYNLYVGGVCGKKASYFWGAVAPWFIGWCFSQGKIFSAFINWTSLFVNGVVNIVIPFMLYYRSQTMTHKPEDIEQDDPIKHSEIYDEMHSTVEPWPQFMKKNALKWTIVMVVLTTIVITMQIVYDLYYWIFKGIDYVAPS